MTAAIEQTAEPAGRAPRTRRRGPWLARSGIVAAAAVAALAVQGAPLALLVVVGVLLGVLMAARPETAALAAVGLIYSNATVLAVREHGVPGAAALLIPVLLLITVGYQVFAHHLPVLLPRAALWMVAFLVVQIVGALASRDPEISVAAVQTYIIEGVVLFVLITNAIRGFRLVRLAAIVVVVVAGVLGALSLLQDISGNKSQDFGGFAQMSNAVIEKADGGGANRHAGPIGEQNRWAQSLAVTIPLAVALGLADRSRLVRLTARVAGIGIVTGVVLTYSRGAVVGLILTALIAVALRWIRLGTTVVFAVVAVLLLLAVAPTFTDRASTVVTAGQSASSRTSSQSGQDGSFTNRSTEAVAATSVFFSHPVIGVGLGLFPTYFQDEARSNGADRIVGVTREAHNLYLGLAAETGVLGLITFGCVVGSILSSLARVRRRHLDQDRDVAALATGFALALITYLTTGLFLHFAYIRYFWLFAALAAAMGMVADPERVVTRRQKASRGRHHDVYTEAQPTGPAVDSSDRRAVRRSPDRQRLRAGPTDRSAGHHGPDPGSER